jgi:hypothetical protein
MQNRVKSLIVLFVLSLGASNTFAVWTTQTCPDGRVVAIASEGTGYCGLSVLFGFFHAGMPIGF